MKFNKFKKVAMPINIVLFNLCRLHPFRKKNVWVFGGWEGAHYDDNSRHLFEYVNKEHPDILAIWLTKDKSVVNQVKSKGYSAYTFYSLRGMSAALRAGVAVYSHGLIDFGQFPLVGGAKIVSLWHGVGFKKIYNAKYKGFKLKAKKILSCFFSWTARDITTVTSEYTRQQFQCIFGLKPKDVFITGQPRNDVLFRQLSKEKVFHSLSISDEKKVILYMPTYRSPSLGKDYMGGVIDELFNNADLNNYLLENDAVFLAKLHPLTPHVCVQNRENFKILDYDAVKSNQELLAVSDVMVTDYSSCFVDFALLNRPIIFYMPDQEKFVTQSEGLDEDFFRISKLNSAQNVQEFVDKLRRNSNVVCEATNELFEDPEIKGTSYCENVYKLVKERLHD